MIPPDLAPERIGAELRSSRYGRALDVRAETGSTNDDARQALEAGAPDGHVVLADRQTAGRGARGRSWSSPGGVDLYLSIVARVPLEGAALAPVTLAVGMGVAEAVEALVAEARVEIKWPNDVWLEGRKCAGVLVEASTGTSGAVIGVGVDVNRERFAPELAEQATSLRLERGAPLDRAIVLARVLEAIEREVDRLVAHGPSPLAARVQERLALRGRPVRCDGAEGVVLGLAPSGALRLRAGERVIELVSGTLRPA